MQKKPVLSISLLVSDRPDTIQRCLDSLNTIRENITSELIIVNTSHSENVRAIIEKYTDKIVDFEWCDDFAKARNAGLSLATGEWFLTLDDDEWFVEVQPLLDFFQSGEYKKYGCANYLVRNFYDIKYRHYSDAWVSRMIRLSKDTHYESKIHEYLYPVHGECRNIEALAYHSGYIYIDEEARFEHFKRNSRLLQKMIEEEPERMRWRVQLLQEYRSVHEYEQMYDVGMECLELFRNVNNETDNRDIGTFYVAAAEGKLFLHEEDEAYRIGSLALKDSRTSELCHAYVMLLYGVIFYHKANWKEAENSIHIYFQIYEYFDKYTQRLEIQKGALLVAEAYDEMALKKAYAILIICGLKRNDMSLLKEYFDRLEWNQNSVYLMDGFMKELVESMAHLPEDDFFVKVVSTAWNHPDLRNSLLEELAPYELNDPQGFLVLQHYLAQLDADHWYLWYTKILDADKQVDVSTLKMYLQKLVSAIANIYCLPRCVIDIAASRGIAMEDIYLQVEVERWEDDWKNFVSEADPSSVQQTVRMIQSMKTKEDVRYELFDIMWTEYSIFAGESECNDYKTMHQRLDTYVSKILNFMQRYPEQDLIMGDVALKMRDALNAESANPKGAIAFWAEVTHDMPKYALIIKNYLLAFNDDYQKQSVSQENEMILLKKQILGEVEKCLANKEYEAALDILKQLRTMLPLDSDITKWLAETENLYLESHT